jgi:hypothetical protein
MEKQKDDILLKVRSSRASIAAGYRLYTGNFRRIFRQTWIAAIVYGIFYGIYTSVFVTEYPKLLLAISSGQVFAAGNMVPSVVTALLPLLIIVATIWLYSQVFSLLFQHRAEGVITAHVGLFKIRADKQSIVRTTVWGLVCLAIGIVCWAIIGALAYYGFTTKSITLMAAAPLTGLVILLLLVPLGYPAMHYLTTRDTKLWAILGKDFGIGMRHWGMLFIVAFITVIISSLILSLTTLPAIILSIANIKAQTGLMMGDPLGMPEYISKLTLLVFTLAGFIQAYVVISIFFPAYYAAGSIETQEQERNEKKNFIY